VISVDYSTTQSQPCMMHVKYGAAGGTVYDLSGKQVFNAGDWHWFGVTFSTNESSGTLTLYLDGQLDTSVSANIAQTLPMFQGPQFFGGSSPVFFEGSIQAVSIFDQALQPKRSKPPSASRSIPQKQGSGLLLFSKPFTTLVRFPNSCGSFLLGLLGGVLPLPLQPSF
jgi:concanavalin A-like lectin/glucanase superfamily protein